MWAYSTRHAHTKNNIQGNSSTRRISSTECQEQVSFCRHRSCRHIISNVFFRTFPIPNVFENLFQNLPRIDIHDHLRQGTLALEKSWKTHAWNKRVFSSVLGVNPYHNYHNHTPQPGCHRNHQLSINHNFIAKHLFSDEHHGRLLRLSLGRTSQC